MTFSELNIAGLDLTCSIDESKLNLIEFELINIKSKFEFSPSPAGTVENCLFRTPADQGQGVIVPCALFHYQCFFDVASLLSSTTKWINKWTWLSLPKILMDTIAPLHHVNSAPSASYGPSSPYQCEPSPRALTTRNG